MLKGINARHSVRAHKGLPLAENVIKILDKQITVLNGEGKLHIQLIQNEPKAFQENYGKVRKVPKC